MYSILVMRNLAQILEEHGIKASAHRVAVAEYVLNTESHPSADEVLSRVREAFPHVSRATVYNTLNLFVDKGLLRQYALTEGRTVFDPRVEDHHHFIDEESGSIHDLPWDALEVRKIPELQGFEVHQYQVVLKGKRK